MRTFEKHPKVSIITISLNTASTIEKTINSVLHQDYDGEIEYILVDGQSVDGTLDIINKYRNQISTLIVEKDTGIYDAVNKGIKNSTGEIIGILHSTDWYEPDAISVSVSNILDNKVDISVGLDNRYDGDTFLGIGPNDTDLGLMWEKDIVRHLSTFVKKSVYQTVGYYDDSYQIAADYKFFLECYIQGVKFGFFDQIVTNFRVGGKSYNGLSTAIEDLRIIKELSLRYVPGKYEENVTKCIRERGIILSDALIRKYPRVATKAFQSLVPPPFAVWGTGKAGKLLIDFLNQHSLRPEHVVDSAYKSKSMECALVEDPEVLKEYKGCVIIAVLKDDKEIIDKISGYNISNVILVKDLFYRWALSYYELEGL